MSDRKKWLQRAENLMNDYCKDCFLYEHNKTDKGKRHAHRFCISECTVGLEIKKYGDMLAGKVKEEDKKS
ncbi:zinc-finger domain-containing protein [Niallia taxi]|uniref:zinc-finger domain-containing protein n=1 Tax=Niallia taxi TaxID=2499688 RepID=UPI002E22FB62|nr:zinc-finger domain-containing protein [Niallia taxi]